ncbi:MAG TPA: MerR family transcriptional regulator [Alphaproteobacteria bacterium]|nr:MerR family transcriptional regulator [Alphaproteobacteria bacterium]
MALNAPPAVSVRPVEMKAPGAFRTISEVAGDLSVPQHVLRFWESKFQQIRPLKRGGGRRYYRPEDIHLLNSIKDLLYNQGFTIRGVQKLLREGGKSPFARGALDSHVAPASASPLHAPSANANAAPGSLSAEKRRAVEGILTELKALREMLRQSGI